MSKKRASKKARAARFREQMMMLYESGSLATKRTIMRILSSEGGKK